MKIIIAGSRTITQYDILEYAIQQSGLTISEVVSGCANGVDKLGMMYARNNNLPLKKFPVDWNQFGKSAGFKRNIDMAKYADALLAIWDQQSRGTLHMIQTAKKHNLIVYTHFV